MREDEDRGLSFDEIVLKYRKKIFNLILRQVNDREEAEELTQETFRVAGREFPAFSGECRIHTWLCQLALQQARIRFRQRDSARERR